MAALLDLTWMEWTRPTAIFFLAIACMLVAMTIWQIRSPSLERRGFLPIPTTPGDRLFIGLLGSAYLFLGWIALTDSSLWIMLVLAIGWMAAVMRWG